MINYVFLADVLAWVVFLFIYTARPAHSGLSAYELHRQAKTGDEHAKKLEQRKKLLPGVLLIKRWLEIILAVLLVWLTVTLRGWLWGIIISVVIIVIADLLSRWQPLKRLATKYWSKLEPKLLLLVGKYAGWLVGLGPKQEAAQSAVHSKQELAHFIASSPALENELKTSLQAALGFYESRVKEVMTPRKNITAVSQDDALGPIILDDLHKTGLNYFPVYEGTIDRVVGVLRLDKLVGDMRKTHKAKKAMEPGAIYISETETLNAALATLLYERQNLLIVVNKSKKTTGVITLQTIIEKLTGYPPESYDKSLKEAVK